jgi:DNA helicase-2/ATP-dependent DNA helicase PcrA
VTVGDIAERRRLAKAQQQRVVDAVAPFFVEACPGAGKTRVIVDRHLAQPSTPRQGRALVSFTEASSAELRRRCHADGRPELAEFPHYVGTIDGFLWRHLVRPALTPDRRWQRLDSWDRVRARVNDRWYLSDFTFRREPGEDQCRADLRQTTRNYSDYIKLAADGGIGAVEQAALSLRRSLTDQGYVTGHEVRIFALYVATRDEVGVRSNVVSRFSELVVDEAQDCSRYDLAILDQLRQAGLPLVLVGDLDQAIYQFRGAQPAHVRRFAGSLGQTIPLTGNWRSSPAICALAHTLRQDTGVRRGPDEAVGDHHDESASVLVLKTKNNRLDGACRTFSARAAELGISEDQQLVVAHAGRRLPPAARSKISGAGLSPSKQLVWAAAMIEDAGTSKRQLDEAYSVLERALLRVWCPETDHHSIESLCESHQINRGALRRLVTGLTLPSVDSGDFAGWCTGANAVLANHPPHGDLARSGSRGALRATGPDRTKRPCAVLGLQPTSAPASRLRGEVIHQVKGDELDAVLMIVPDDDRTDELMEAWGTGARSDTLSEALRVLYVAATRARRLLAIAVPERSYCQLTQHLRNCQVPFSATTS